MRDRTVEHKGQCKLTQTTRLTSPRRAAHKDSRATPKLAQSRIELSVCGGLPQRAHPPPPDPHQRTRVFLNFAECARVPNGRHRPARHTSRARSRRARTSPPLSPPGPSVYRRAANPRHKARMTHRADHTHTHTARKSPPPLSPVRASTAERLPPRSPDAPQPPRPPWHHTDPTYP